MIEPDFAPYTYDDDLTAATRHDGKSRVRVYRLAAPVVVLGSGSRADVELNLDACRTDAIPILRRRGGGCSVVLDPGNVIVSTVATELPFGGHRRQFDLITNWLIDGLTDIGLPGIHQDGICDLVLDDKKVGRCLHAPQTRSPILLGQPAGRPGTGYRDALPQTSPARTGLPAAAVITRRLWEH